ncbi:hypothetical protein [Viridibacillus arvi]|jgi:hypothetical protein|uniref:Antigen I/II N-terminal domain-containing protein n=1 Tax=Viridibacillus arvi TaxID=263475 RepID=A0A0M0LB46_9BACL|nr:hypothetical protein [Viridibacillus arvi]KOO47888.1 hypothetical protein AMD00_19845 [Viridibacillus arvi]
MDFKVLLAGGIIASTLVISGCSSGEIAENKQQDKSDVAVNRDLMNIEIKVPASFYEGEDIDAIIADAKEKKRYIKVGKNSDGSVTYIMSREQHDTLIKEMKESTASNVKEIEDDSEIPSVLKISNNSNFSEFIITVDKKEFENSFDSFAVFSLGIAGMFYQVFDGTAEEDLKVTVKMKDAKNGKIFNEIIYPDALDDIGEEN